MLNIDYKNGLVITKNIINKLYQKINEFENTYLKDIKTIAYDDLIK